MNARYIDIAYDPHTPPSNHPVGGLNVLVAEDDPATAEVLARTLEDVGHEVRVLYDGRDALTAALIDPPDVAVLDVGLPRLDGWRVARRLRRALGQRPCLLVALSGHDGPADDRHLSRMAGFDLHLAKPFDPRALARALVR